MPLPVIDVTFTRHWPAAVTRFMLPVERPVLAELAAAGNAETIVEVGCNDGITARYLLDNCPLITSYIGVEVAAGYRPVFSRQAGEIPRNPGHLALADGRFTLIVRDRGSFDVVVDEFPAVDMFIIDGDHGAVAVRHDAALARRVVRPGGMILYHDYKRTDDRGRPDPVNCADVIEAMAQEGAPISAIRGTWLALERVGDGR
jgi:SAM-dependent methyltransferase